MTTNRNAKISVDGVALLDKPPGLSSNQALQQLKRHLGATKAGHCGTLDPMATGLLLIAFGEATKFAQQWLEANKTYTFRIVFGVATDSGDAEGRVTARVATAIDEAALTAVLPAFHGTVTQVPPMVSALKYQGQPLYALARQGVEVERAPRQVVIDRLVLCAFDQEAQRAVLQATVSKGTYIRTLAEQIGAALGVPAHIDQLRREAIGPFTCAQARSLAQWLALPAEAARAALLPCDRLVSHLPAIILNEGQAERFRHGQTVALSRSPVPEGARSLPLVVRVFGQSGPSLHFLGTGEWNGSTQLLSPKRVVAKLLPCLMPSELTSGSAEESLHDSALPSC